MSHMLSMCVTKSDSFVCIDDVRHVGTYPTPPELHYQFPCLVALVYGTSTVLKLTQNIFLWEKALVNKADTSHQRR